MFINNRPILGKFWTNEFVRSLTWEKKYFLLLQFINSAYNQSGGHDVTLDQLSAESGFSKETVMKLLNFFRDEGRILWESDKLILVNWEQYAGIQNDSQDAGE